MKRRGFLQRIALGMAALAIPLPKCLAARPRINPEWVNAPYEIRFGFKPVHPRQVFPILFKRPANDRSLQKVLLGPDGKILTEHYPVRISSGGNCILPILEK